jgi:hypothetical protein
VLVTYLNWATIGSISFTNQVGGNSRVVVSSNRLSISWQVLQIEAALRAPDVGREDLAHILQAVQVQEKQNLRMVGQPRNHTLGLNVYI